RGPAPGEADRRLRSRMPQRPRQRDHNAARRARPGVGTAPRCSRRSNSGSIRMTPIIKAFDHVLVGVDDLEAARRNWERLGFTACPRGRHIGWGTANYCLMFPENYVELIGIVDPDQFTNNLDSFLA